MEIDKKELEELSERLHGLLDEFRDLEPQLGGLPEELLRVLVDFQNQLPEELATRLLKLQEKEPEELPKGLQDFLNRLQSLEQEGLSDELLAGLLDLLKKFRNLEKEKIRSEKLNIEETSKSIESIKELETMNDKTLKGMPEGFSLPRGSLLKDTDETWRETTFMSAKAERLIEHGNLITEEFHDHLSAVLKNNEDSGVFQLFGAHVGPPQDIEPLREELEQEEFIAQISQADRTRDEALATADNAFNTGNVDQLSQIQKAKANWLMAVRKYESDSRQAWRSFKISLDKLSVEKGRAPEKCNDVYQEVKHYKRSSEVSEALLTYEQARAQATAELATAHGELVNELFTSGADAAVGEATLIQAAESATETFWTSVQNALDNPSS